jgi:uroporphyrinogen decarboxylase
MKKFISTLSGNIHATPPIWFMRQAGRYLPEYREIRRDVKDFTDLCYNSDLASEVTLQPIKRYGFDAAILFSDILVIPDALGLNLRFKTGVGPILDAINSYDAIPNKNIEQAIKFLSPVFDTITKVKKDLPNETTFIGFAGSPWTVATYMIEGGSSKNFAKIKELAYKSPSEFQKIIDLLVEITSKYLIKQIESGVEVVKLFDSWSGVLPENEFRKWVINPNKRIVENIRKIFPDFPIIGFPRKAGFFYPEYAKETKVTALAIDETLPLSWAKDNLANNVVLQGNIDPVILLSDKDKIYSVIKDVLTSFYDIPFILNLGHGILPNTPLENVDFFLNTVRELSPNIRGNSINYKVSNL